MEENPHSGPGSDDLASPPPREKSLFSTAFTVLIVVGLVALLIALLLPARRRSREAARRNQCLNQLKQVGLALQKYANAHGALPPAYTTDADGKPLHSWRTLILPYLDRKALYDSIDLTKPWDDPVNAVACKALIGEYDCPSVPDAENRTTYLAVVTPDSCLRPAEPRPLSEVTDGLAQTIVVIEVDVDHAVPWMSPVDADEKVVLGVGPPYQMAHFGGVFGALFVDGGARFFNEELTAAQRRALISIAGGDQALARAALEDKD